VIEQISELLIAGHLHIHLRPMRVTTGRPAEGEPSQPSFPISERQAPKATTPSLKVQTPPDPPTFPPNVNAAQQAEAHVEAAVNGTPFCAVCAALAAARAAAAEAASRG
jgi:hypothetical protein